MSISTLVFNGNIIQFGGSNIVISTAGIPPTITTSSLPAGSTGNSYSATMAATGGTAPYTWSIIAGTLPAGISFSSAGIFAGTPTAISSVSLTIQVTDSATLTASVTLTLSVTTVAALTITTLSLPTGTVGTAYSATMVATGGTSPYTWSLIGGTLPAGLSFSTAGVFAGTPTALATSSLTLQVADSASNTTSITLPLNVITSLTVTTASLPAGINGGAYSTTMSASGGTAPYTWAITGGTLPTGLSFSTAGVFSGTPSVTTTVSLTITVTDSVSHTASTTLSLVIEAPVTITTASLPAGTSGTAYSATMAATGGTNSYTWAITAGTLPTGLSFSTAGVFSGTPTVAATASLTITVTDSASHTASTTLGLTIVGALTITTTSLPTATDGTAYSATMAVTGGTAPYTWSLTVASGTLASGITFSTAGVFGGTPSTASTASLNITVTDSAAHTKTSTLTLTANPSSGTVLPGAPTNLNILFQGMSSPGQGTNGSSPAPNAPNTQAIGWNQGTTGTYPITQNKIYRGANGATPTLYATITAGTSYTDTAATNCLGSTATPHNAQGQNWPANGYLYQVSSVDSQGNEGPKSGTQIFVIYKNGIQNGTGGNDNNNLTTTYNDTTGIAGNPAGSTNVILNVSTIGAGQSQFLPFAGNNATFWNIWCGHGAASNVFNYLNFSLRPSATGQTFNFWVEYRTDSNGDPGSQTGIPGAVGTSTTYGPASVVNVWGTYKLPLSVLMVADAADGSIIEGMFYKLGINDITGSAGNHWWLDNIYLSYA